MSFYEQRQHVPSPFTYIKLQSDAHVNMSLHKLKPHPLDTTSISRLVLEVKTVMSSLVQCIAVATPPLFTSKDTYIIWSCQSVLCFVMYNIMRACLHALQFTKLAKIQLVTFKLEERVESASAVCCSFPGCNSTIATFWFPDLKMGEAMRDSYAPTISGVPRI